MNGRLGEGVYNFEVKVFDKVWNREVVSTVRVTVQEIGDEPVINSGSLRLSGTFSNSSVQTPSFDLANCESGLLAVRFVVCEVYIIHELSV